MRTVRYYYVRLSTTPRYGGSFGALPAYGPEQLTVADLARFTDVEFSFDYAAAIYERQGNGFLLDTPPVWRETDNRSFDIRHNQPIRRGAFAGASFSAAWRDGNSHTPLFFSGGCSLRGVVQEAKIDVQLDLAAQRVARLRFQTQEASDLRGQGDTGGCTASQASFLIEAAGMAYSRDASTPSFLVFEFPTGPGQTACDAVSTFEGSGQKVQESPARGSIAGLVSTWAWRTRGFDCNGNVPYRIAVSFRIPRSTP
jgi:hypothetical protein